ncbi:hypothetical protein [Photobacterium sanguinicancri]|uniref:Bacterial Ig-like domain-containing protein n=1 Tax=Photobacterium sanguinicancri TaxID=875932 RepID=A0AAW7Y0G8_9GAMM|nr:hypothetical protein [Photobacterium sanguinicancri]MDO6541256.1 hypothetical protein [Photobacterium sanguinicancri]
MTSFIDSRGITISSVKIPKNDIKRLRTNGLTARIAKDITLTSGKQITSTLKPNPYNGGKGQWTIDIKATAVGKTTLKAKVGAKEATLDIEVFASKIIQLPEKNTEQGLLARLFIAESVNPSSPRYKEVDASTSMLWMRQVIENRKADNKPSRFAISTNTNVTYKDVITARNQFHGFEGYPSLIESISNNLSLIMTIANNYNHPERETYSNFVTAALNAAKANALAKFTDPTSNGLYGWRTKGSSEPGGDFVKHGNLAGQTFYTLK